MLRVKLLTETATAPTVAHPGEDVAFDLYADENVTIPPMDMRYVKTGIAIQFHPPAGAIIKSRSSMAKQYSSVEGGVIDAGYRGEILVLLHNRSTTGFMRVVQGNKVAQMVKTAVIHEKVKVVEKLANSKRGKKGFGSTGK